MSIEVTAVILSTMAPAILKSLWPSLRQALRDKGAKDLPDEIKTQEHGRMAAIAVIQHQPLLDSEEAFRLDRQTVSAAQSSAETVRDERLRQARLTFNAATSLSVIGVLVIFVGVGFLLFGSDVTVGGIITAGGAVSEVIALTLFRLNSDANNRLDDVRKDLNAIETARLSLTIVDHIEDVSKKDDAIKEIARALSRGWSDPFAQQALPGDQRKR